MTTSNKTYGVVCYANYCRSPVAEFFLKERFKHHNIYSAGLSPMVAATMDPRSLKYLSSQYKNIPIHTPQKINKILIDKSEVIFCLDPRILLELNRIFPKSHKKFKMLNYKMPKISLADPYKFEDEEYTRIMDNIKILIANLEL